MLYALITLAIIVGLVVFFISIYNRLVRHKNQASNALSQIDVQLKRRHDLIPNLVETAKRYMGHEADTLQAVTEARSQAQAAQSRVGNVSDTQQLAQLSAAEGKLSRALGQFYAVAESYPELKADAMMMQVMDELTNTENRIGFARQHYNDSVMFYNNEREIFPNSLISGSFGFGRLQALEFEDKAVIDRVPQVNFG